MRTRPVLHVERVNADNARNLASATERDTGLFADAIDKAMKSFLEATSVSTSTTPMRWHDVSASVGAVFGVDLADLLAPKTGLFAFGLLTDLHRSSAPATSDRARDRVHRCEAIGHHGSVGLVVEGSLDADVGVRAALHAAIVNAPTP